MTASLANPEPNNLVALSARSAPTMTPALVASSTAWLESWTPAEPVPATERTRLPAVVAAAEQHVQPADAKAFAIAMKPLVDWVQRYGVVPLEPTEADGGRPGRRREQIADIVRGYREDLGDLPADVLADAVRAVIGSYRFSSLPKPGDFRAAAGTELSDRKARLMRLRTAAMMAEREAKARAEYAAPRERTAEQVAAAAAMVAEVSRMEVAPRAMPAERDDLKPQDDDRREAIRRVMAETKAFRRVPKPGETRAEEASR